MKISIIGSLTREHERLLVAACGDSPAGHLEITLEGPGGDALRLVDCLKAIESLQKAGGLITSRCDTYALSAHAVLFAAADRRIMGEHAWLMTHPCTTPKTHGDRNDVQRAADTLTQADAFLGGLLARQTGVEPQLAEQWLSTEHWFNAEEALHLGLATELVPGSRATEAALAECFGMAGHRLPAHILEAAAAAKRSVNIAALGDVYQRKRLDEMSRTVNERTGDLAGQVRAALRTRYGIKNIPVSALYETDAFRLGCALVDDGESGPVRREPDPRLTEPGGGSPSACH